MDNQDLEHIQQVIGYRFQNWDLLQQAFVRRSYSEENGGENNEVLEFIGDSPIVAHNGIDFDFPFINHELEMLKNEMQKFFICTTYTIDFIPGSK